MQLATDEALNLCKPIPPADQITKSEQEAIQDKITTARDMAAVNQSLKKVDESLTVEQSSKISLEELLYHIENYQKAEQQLRSNQLELVRKAKQRVDYDRTLEGVFGKKKKEEIDNQLKEQKTMERLGQLAKPKDKWKRLRILMDLQKQFRHDITLQKMIKEELKSNKVFKFPEEYDLYDDQENLLCKH